MIAPEYKSPIFIQLDALDLANAEARIARLDADVARAASCYVLILESSMYDELRESSLQRNAILKRALKKPVLAMSLAPNGRKVALGKVEENSCLDLSDRTLLVHLRNCELSKIIKDNRSACILNPPAGYHLVTPSGRHCERFLRIANAASNVEALDTMARWLAPEIAPAGAILADNWTVCPPVLRAMSHVQKSLTPFDFFKGHAINDIPATHSVIERILQTKNDGPVVFILSVNASGKFASFVQEAIESDSIECRPISLYRFCDSNKNINALCSLQMYAGYVSPENCSLCKKQKKIISIDPNVYYLREYVENEVLLRKQHFKLPKSFFSKFKDCTDVFAVHRDDPNDGRHHAMYIDVYRLLQNPTFASQCRSQLDKYRGAEIIVTPSHNAGRELGAMAAEHLDVPHVIHDNLRLRDGLTNEESAKLKKAKKVLILDDVLMSGTRLDAYTTALRENSEIFGSFEVVNFLVAIARPESRKIWEEIETSLTKHAPWESSLQYVEKIYLPLWNEKQCPWCLEYDFLSKFSKKIAEPPSWLQRRQRQLMNRTEGITGEPLLLLPPSQSVRLGTGALAGGKGFSSICTLFSVMAAVQNLRCDPDDGKRMQQSLLIANVFKPKNFTNYSEGLLRAALLRSLIPSELGKKSREESNKKLLKALTQSSQHLIFGELLFAMYRDLLPKTSRMEIANYMKTSIPDSVSMLLREILGDYH